MQPAPKIEWKDGEFQVSLPVQDGGRIEAKWRPGATSVVRIREVGTDSWGPGFETPLNGCSFVDLKPSTEYEIQLTHKNAAGEGPAVIKRIKTSPDGGKVIPFPTESIGF